MRPVLNKIRERALRAADRASARTGAPAGEDAAAPIPANPSARDRSAMRRRIRRLRSRRDALLLELGGLVMEMQRQGRGDQQLVAKRAEEVGAVDAEARELARALDGGDGLEDVIAAGIVGACGECGDLVSIDARYCSRCGTPVGKARSNGSASNGSRQAADPDGTPSAEPAAQEQSAGVAER
jgi:hypothetical protein